MLKSAIQNKVLKTLPDDRPITSIQIIENVDKCPTGFYPISRTYDQDQDADLWRDGSFFKRSSGRYLCLSKSEGLPDFVVQEIIVLNEKVIPPEGYSLLHRTADTEQRAWRKRQLCYRLVNRKTTRQAVTDIIVCNRLKKAPDGFTFAGEINGVIVCYKMGNVQDGGSSDNNGIANDNSVPNIPPRRAPSIPNSPSVYPSLNDGGDHDYEILKPGYGPSRPAPRPPLVSNQSTHTLASSHNALDGVPFVINSKFLNSSTANKFQFPVIKARTMQQLLKDYDYSFAIERQS